MYSSAFLVITAFLCCLVLTPGVRWLSLRLGVVDQPDPQRKFHKAPTARLGGVAIALSCVAAFGILAFLPFAAGAIVRENVGEVLNLLPALAVMFLTGLLDDIRNLRPWQKLSGQAIAATLAYLAGVRILGIAGVSIESWWSFPLTVLWLMGCANAFNLIDGMDGLAAGIGLFAGVTAFVAAIFQNNVPLALATAPLIGCLLAFLVYNFSPASIFLGDSGSLVIGFVLGCYGVIWSQKSATVLGMTAPVMALAVPLLDTGLALIRRFLRSRPVFSADRGHIHHRLLDRGLTPRRVTLLLYAVAGFAAILSLLQQVFYERYAGLILVLFCAGALAGIRALGMLEFDAARRVLFPDAFRHMLDRQIALRQFESALDRTTSLDQAWNVIREHSREFGFLNVRLYALGEMRELQHPSRYVRDCWQVRVPLGAAGYMDFEYSHYDEPHLAAHFIDLVCRLVPARLPAPIARPPQAAAVRAS